MSYAWDYLVAELPCPHCGAVSPATGETRMITALRDDASMRYLTAGDELPADVEHARAADYLIVREPASGGPVNLLHTWACPACETAFLWARVVVRDGVIAAIELVTFAEAIGSAHYVDDDARWLVADRLGARSPTELSEDQVLATLRSWGAP
jgi:hypothetical protein